MADSLISHLGPVLGPRSALRSLAAMVVFGVVALVAVVAVPGEAMSADGGPTTRPTGEELGPVAEDEVVIGDAPSLPPPVERGGGE